MWVGLTILLTSCSTAHHFNGAELDPPLTIPDFELIDTTGQPFRLSKVDADLILVYFGYTYCPDVCPLTLWNVKQALEGLAGREHVQTIFITVDPERDTPETLAVYMPAFEADFIGLTGDQAQIQTVLHAFGATATKEELLNSKTQYLVSHTSRLYLLTPGRKAQLTYSYGFSIDDLRADLAHLLTTHNLN
ncbi:SCO family protein [Anaerolineales bacterium HSG25]|nr:SCO family protein [Anaerolineales bacterium HSG25]